MFSDADIIKDLRETTRHSRVKKEHHESYARKRTQECEFNQ